MTPQGDTPLEWRIAAHWKSQGLAARTIEARLRAFRRAGGMNATKDSVEAYLACYASARTRRLHLSMLRTTYRIAVGMALMERDPTALIGRVRVPRSLPKPLNKNEVALALDQMKEPARTYLVLGLYAGLRACEIATVSVANLESYPGGWRLRVVGKGGHEGLVPAHKNVVEALSRWQRPDRLTANAVTQAVRYEFHRLGIEGGVHRARHTFATNALAAADNDLLVVRDLLRHSSVATTQVYTALVEDRPANVVALLA